VQVYKNVYNGNIKVIEWTGKENWRICRYWKWMKMEFALMKILVTGIYQKMETVSNEIN